MKIKKIVSQHRRDFIAIYECEHCGHEEKGVDMMIQISTKMLFLKWNV